MVELVVDLMLVVEFEFLVVCLRWLVCLGYFVEFLGLVLVIFIILEMSFI